MAGSAVNAAIRQNAQKGDAMPAAAFIVPAVATIAGAAISAHQQGNATKAQSKSASDTLAFEKSQEDERRKEWEYQQQAAASAWQARQAMLAPFQAGAYSVLAKYGINTQMPSATQMPPVPGAPGAMPAPSYATPGAPPPPSMAGAPTAGGASTNVPQAPQATTLGGAAGSPFGWNDWSRYGAGSSPNA